MTTPRLRRPAGAVVGAATALLVLVALVALGGQRLGEPAGRFPSADRTTAAGSVHGPARVVVDRPAPGSDRPQLVGLPPVAPATVAAAIVLLGLAVVAHAAPGPARPLPVRAGRGPPPRG